MNATVTDQQGRTLIGDQANNIGPFMPLASGACVNSASSVVISQVYGGGGNTGGLFRNDFIELHNRSEVDVDVTGWSVQYAFNFTPPATDQGFLQSNVVAINGIIPAGGYYLIQQSQGADGSQPALPTPDAIGGVTVSSTSGRVALVRSTTAIGLNFTSPDIEDFVGYGTAAPTWEGLGSARTTSNTTAVLRDQDGCEDSDNNNLDFSLLAPNPRNSASPLVVCPRVCVADLDDGTATGTPDGGVTIDDLLFYLVLFEAGDIRADVDDGSSTGARDCGVTIDDLLYFLFRFESGC
jgi:predicted extracellular nuclease